MVNVVDGNISDLFFNSDHHAARDFRGDFIEHDELPTEAKNFLDCLARLGVDVPTVDELIEDFQARV